MAARIRRGDRVMVIAGSYRGQVGTVVQVKAERATVDGINMLVRHVKKKADEPGRIEKILGGIHVSNLSHIDESNKSIKVSFLVKDGVKYLVNRRHPEQEIRKV